MFNTKINLFLRARYPVIYINTLEEERLEYVLRNNLEVNLNRNIYSWDFIDGYKNNNLNIENFSQKNPFQALEVIEKINFQLPTLFLLKDFNQFLKDFSISRKLRNMTPLLKLHIKTILISSSHLNFPKELKELITWINFDLPGKKEIYLELERLIYKLNLTKNLPTILFQQLVFSCQGLSLERIRRVFAKILLSYKTIDKNSIFIFLNEKKQIVNQTDILEYYSVNDTFVNLGGLKVLKEWLKKRKIAFNFDALKYGLPIPRGLLLIGIQGTGKSLVAKYVSNKWKLPLLKLDVGKLFAGIIGESESRLRKMIKLTESISPCVLWIDEIDKAFTNQEHHLDSGTNSRILGTFISWLSEKTKPVFLLATANNIDFLPLEILRKGRFDEVFFLDLPQKFERKEIFEIHLQVFRPNNWKSYNSKKFADLSESFSGAEIKQTIIDAMYEGFYKKREFTTTDVCTSIQDLIPLANFESKQINKLKNWALSGQIRLASIN
uniref:Uncharacterized AAA domain-containing protein ycf46 n=1 Tax=Astrosyne radiata TaxID=1158023 RepID=A0A2U9NTN9_9STRA|nr:hypothetical protein ycf46 [Astrosyne radiata]AWT40382.1 hypothetical protein ycf46 [Astrosyne radiata]